MNTKSSESEIVMKEIPNTGVPKDGETNMSNQCFWISISDWFKLKGRGLSNGEHTDDLNRDDLVPNVKNIKKLAGCGQFICNGDDEQTEIMEGNPVIEGTLHPIHGQQSKEAIINFANKTGTILIFSKSRHFKH